MAVDIAAQAAQAAAQGQQQLTDYKNKATTAQGQFTDFNNQATDANKKVSDYTDYMKNEGSAQNVYHGEQDKQLGDLGYDPQQMTAARANLNQATGALSAYSDFANTSASKWGMNAGGFAAANAGALSGINNNIAANQGVVSGLSDLYKTAQTGANQLTGNVIAGEHETLAGLKTVFDNAKSQADSARSMMNFYDDLASKQGGLNAQQQQFYGQAQQAYAQASAAQAQAALYGQQAALAKQQLDHQADLYKNPQPVPGANGAAPGGTTPGSGGPAWYGIDNISNYLSPGIHNAAAAAGHAASVVGNGAKDWAKGLFTGASW
jgi:hypothetical protein